jgi:hypothetical protein
MVLMRLLLVVMLLVLVMLEGMLACAHVALVLLVLVRSGGEACAAYVHGRAWGAHWPGASAPSMPAAITSPPASSVPCSLRDLHERAIRTFRWSSTRIFKFESNGRGGTYEMGEATVLAVLTDPHCEEFARDGERSSRLAAHVGRHGPSAAVVRVVQALVVVMVLLVLV